VTNSESTGSNYLRLHEIYSVADNNIFFVIQCNSLHRFDTVAECNG